jgi:hypothetical protein
MNAIAKNLSIPFVNGVPPQVSVAVLLDNFVKASAEMEHEAENLNFANAIKFGPVLCLCINLLRIEHGEL